MSSQKNVNTLILSGEGLHELPEEIFNYEKTLINLDISGNNFLDLESVINSLKIFKKLKTLKINIFTPEEAKLVIENLPNLEYLNDELINEDDQSNSSKENIKEYDNEDDEEEEEEEEAIINISIVKLVDKEFENVFKKLKDFYSLNPQKEKDFQELVDKFNEKSEKNKININDKNEMNQKELFKKKYELFSFLKDNLIKIKNEALNENMNYKDISIDILNEAICLNDEIGKKYENKNNDKNNKENNNSNDNILNEEVDLKMLGEYYIEKEDDILSENVKIQGESTENIENENKNKNNVQKLEMKEINNNENKIPEKNINNNKDNENEKEILIPNTKNNIYLCEEYNPEISNENKNDEKINKKQNKINQSKSNQLKKKNKKIMNNNTSNQDIHHKKKNNIFIEELESKRNKTSPWRNRSFNSKISARPFSLKSIGGKNQLIKKYAQQVFLAEQYGNIPINELLNKNKSVNLLNNLFEGGNNNEKINYDSLNTRVINLGNLLDIINQIYKIRKNRIEKQKQGLYSKGTLEQDLYTYLKSKYGLNKLIIEWNINILSAVQAYNKINGEVYLFGLLLRNELDEDCIEILQKIRKTVDDILNFLYDYKNDVVTNIQNNKEFIKENEWKVISKCLYSDDNILREKFVKKITCFIDNLTQSTDLPTKTGKKILFCDFMNILIKFNLKLRKKYLHNLFLLFSQIDEKRCGIINHQGFIEIIKKCKIIPDEEKAEQVATDLIEIADKEGCGQITFNDTVQCLDNLDLILNEGKVKFLDKLSKMNLDQN